MYCLTAVPDGKVICKAGSHNSEVQEHYKNQTAGCPSLNKSLKQVILISTEGKQCKGKPHCAVSLSREVVALGSLV